MNKSFAAALLAGIVISSCSNGNKTSEETEEESEDTTEVVADTLHLFEESAPPVAADELFDDFFFNFASDVKYQRQRIKFPLPVTDSGQKLELSREDWHRYNRFKAQEFYTVIYEREHDLELKKDTTIKQVCIEWIDLKEDYIEQFNFHRLKGKWMLTDITKDETKNSPNGNFLKFYSQFVSDSTFQRESLAQPLKFIVSSDYSEESNEEEELSPDEWFEMQAEMPVFNSNAIVNIDYGQTCISQNRKILLMQGVSNGILIKFKFDKSNGNWRLIEIDN